MLKFSSRKSTPSTIVRVVYQIRVFLDNVRVINIIMVALWNRADHYILSFVLLLFSSPNLSRRRLDVYHTVTHGVALVRI